MWLCRGVWRFLEYPLYPNGRIVLLGDLDENYFDTEMWLLMFGNDNANDKKNQPIDM